MGKGLLYKGSAVLGLLCKQSLSFGLRSISMASPIKRLIRPITNRMRRRRFLVFMELIRELPRPLTILDIGGTESYWDEVGLQEAGLHIILLNLEQKQVNNSQLFSSVAGNATDLSNWSDKSVDLVFSNSVIEHLFTFDSQRQMAQEVQRVGKSFFIQTPNYYFPLEPHWLFPLFQFLPRSWRIKLTQRASWGHMPKLTDPAMAAKLVDEVRLLTSHEMSTLFPAASLYFEPWMGLKKSISAYYIDHTN